ncbi:MFS transporter [Methylocystis hirsuta]|uniref:MFS transporter n=1 Tax=Methylocystis hirsuta TaxID=369798 RepID=A0A3M9XNR1_9HYPH|nr:MFS transporter [Methylocystis hirsuta]RNJ48758.1 MFS transporter [Methylocystis hirsuta]
MTASPSNAASVFSALDEAPMTWRHYAYWLAASGGAFLDGFSVSALGVALPLLKRDFPISPLFVGLIGSALVLGAVAGSALGGVGADRFGRKRVFIADMAIIALACFIGAAAPNARVILLSQFLLGVGVGIDFPTSGAYVSELMPRASRNRMTVATIALQSVGMAAAALAGLAILKLRPSTEDWRLLFGAGGAIALLFLSARIWAPESVRWLVAKGRISEARALLRTLLVEFGEPPENLGAKPVALVASKWASAPKAQDLGYSALFSEAFRARTMLVALPWMLMDVATYGVGLFTPVILGAMHLGAADAGSLAADFADAEGSAIVDAFLIIGFVASLWAVPRFGRITMQVAGFSGMGLGMLLLLFAAMSDNGANAHLAFVIGGFMLFNFAMNAGPNATTFTLAPTLFPTTIRASASGFAAASAKVGATFGTFVVPQLQAGWGLTGVVALMVAVSVAGLLATAGLAHAINEEGALEE